MGWDAELVCDACQHRQLWGYTFNCTPMFAAAAESAGLDARITRDLDGLTGPEGARMLDAIVTELKGDPERYRAMNPPNGWGDYDSYLATLIEMRDAVSEWPSHWGVT